MTTASGSSLRIANSAVFTAVVALVGALGDKLHAALAHRLQDLELGAAKAVVLVQDGDPRHAEVRR